MYIFSISRSKIELLKVISFFLQLSCEVHNRYVTSSALYNIHGRHIQWEMLYCKTSPWWIKMFVQILAIPCRQLPLQACLQYLGPSKLTTWAVVEGIATRRVQASMGVGHNWAYGGSLRVANELASPHRPDSRAGWQHVVSTRIHPCFPLHAMALPVYHRPTHPPTRPHVTQQARADHSNIFIY